MQDEEFRLALRWRLGLTAPPSTCLNQPKNGGDYCNEAVDLHGDHAFLCQLGPVRGATHRQYAEAFADFLEECGAVARREAYVKEIRGAGGTASFLDVWASGHVELADVLVDVTRRHPMKVACQPRAAHEPGRCCEQAAADKERAYPATAGRRVTTACFETWGAAQ